MSISENVRSILSSLPRGVTLVAAAKSRTAEEVNEAIAAGIRVVGQNYLQDAECVFSSIASDVRRHFIGHLQSNKTKRVVELFDMIETVDASRAAREIEKRCAAIGKTIDVLIEINSACEPQKHGVFPEHVFALAQEIVACPHLRLRGVMTMGTALADAATLRKNFRATKQIFDSLALCADARMQIDTLSMGMSDSYTIAIEEGANLVRIGTALFGRRT